MDLAERHAALRAARRLLLGLGGQIRPRDLEEVVGARRRSRFAGYAWSTPVKRSIVVAAIGNIPFARRV